MRVRPGIFLTVLIATFCWSPLSLGIDHGPIVTGYELAPVSPGRFHLSPNVYFFKTTANYDSSGGSFDDLPNGGSYQNISGNLNLAYDMNSHWRVLGGFRLANATSNDGTFDRTATEFNEITLGFMVTPYYSVGTRVYLELVGTAVLNAFEDTTDEVLTGEGAPNVIVGSKVTQMLSLLEFFGSLHLQYYSDGRSARIPWRLGAIAHFGTFKVIGSLFGYQSVIDDESTDTPTDRTNVTNRVNGGSQRYYAVNPSLLDTQAGVAWQPFPDLQVELGLTKTINGESTAEGLGAYLGVAMYWGGDDGDTGRSRKRRRKILRHKPKPEERFETKQELYDEELFNNKKLNKRKKRRRQAIDIDKAIEGRCP